MNNGIKSRYNFDRIFKFFAYLILFISFLLCVNSLIQAKKFVGNNFPGFFLFNTLTVSQVTLPHWAQQQDYGLQSYDKVLSVNEQKVSRSTEVYQTVNKLPAGTIIDYEVLRNNKSIDLHIPSIEFKLSDLLQVYATQFIAGLILLITGAFVFFSRPNIISSKFFFLLCCSFGIWLIEDIDYQTFYSLSYTINIPYLAQTFTPAFWVLLAMVFPYEKAFYTKNKHFIIYPLAISLILFVLQLYYLNVPVAWKIIDLVILLYQIIGALMILASVIYTYRLPKAPIDKNRAAVVLLGSFFGFFIPAIGCAIIILSGYSNITYMAILVILFPISIAYAIVKYKLFDIDVIIRKTLVYASLSGVLGFAIVIMILGFNFFFASQGGWKSPGFFVFLSVFLVVALNPVRDKLQNTIDGAFFRQRYDYERTIFNLGEAMTSILNIDEIGSKLINTITDTMQIDSGSLLILDRESEVYIINVTTLDELKTGEVKLEIEDVLVSCLNEHRTEIFYEDLISDDKFSENKETLLETFKKLQSSLIMPLFFKDDLVGILSLGQKKSGLLFNTRDINLLKTLANQSAIAVENAFAFKLVEDYATRLEDTNKELMQTHLQLMQAEKMSAVGELAAGLAHEIRNPLNIIEGARFYLSTEVDHGMNADVVDEYLEFIKNQVVRTNRLVNNLLNFSKPDEPNFQPVNLNSILENAIVLIKKQFTDSNINLEVSLDHNMPEVMGDQNQLWQVFINLLINASQAMQSGGDFNIYTYRRDRNPEYAYIEFQDTGEGISEENLTKIFDPFFTTKSKGSGLGLSISYKIIESHNGQIKVDSVEGEGTTFTIQLPVNNLNSHDRDTEEKSISS